MKAKPFIGRQQINSVLKQVEREQVDFLMTCHVWPRVEGRTEEKKETEVEKETEEEVVEEGCSVILALMLDKDGDFSDKWSDIFLTILSFFLQIWPAIIAWRVGYKQLYCNALVHQLNKLSQHYWFTFILSSKFGR